MLDKIALVHCKFVVVVVVELEPGMSVDVVVEVLVHILVVVVGVHGKFVAVVQELGRLVVEQGLDRLVVGVDDKLVAVEVGMIALELDSFELKLAWGLDKFVVVDDKLEVENNRMIVVDKRAVDMKLESKMQFAVDNKIVVVAHNRS